MGNGSGAVDFDDLLAGLFVVETSCYELAGVAGGGVRDETATGVNDVHGVDQSMTPWSPGTGGRGPPTTFTMSPTRLKLKNCSALAGLTLMQPCDTLVLPCAATDHGAACTYSPLSGICTSE